LLGAELRVFPVGLGRCAHMAGSAMPLSFGLAGLRLLAMRAGNVHSAASMLSSFSRASAIVILEELIKDEDLPRMNTIQKMPPIHCNAWLLSIHPMPTLEASVEQETTSLMMLSLNLS
jgi:hypothetical protein